MYFYGLSASNPRHPHAVVVLYPNPSQANPLVERALSNAPNGYVPTEVDCPPNRPEIRNADGLSQAEKDWLPLRRNATVPAIRDLLRRVAIPGFDSEAYLANVGTDATALPNIGIAASGGGYRAMLCGAGMLAAWDSRTTGATGEGQLGGLLQSATYLSALSGGGWLVGSLYSNNFTTVEKSIAPNSKVWQLNASIAEGPSDINIVSYASDVYSAIDEKESAGYNISITDFWGRMLSYQLIDAPDGGIGVTFSSIAEDKDFSSGNAPLPLIVADGRSPGEKLIPVNTTIFEFNPWELGSFDSGLQGFVPLKYVGSNFSGGFLPKDEKCVEGFDNAGFVMGTSSSLFNQFILQINTVSASFPKVLVNLAESVLNHIGDDENDIADWTPNPFYNFKNETNLSASSRRLTLVDGGEDLQNIPYHPLIQNSRAVDVIFSFDSSADTEYSWPNGASPAATYARSQEDIAAGTSFPAVPDNVTFVNLGLNTRPTFFGCDSANTTGPSPLIVYIPNYPYVFSSNITTFTFEINNTDRNAIIQNGWDVATMGNATRDPQWPVCVGCAMLHRSWERTKTPIPEACNECFSKYCWDGTVNASTPAEYDPPFVLDPVSVESGALRRESPAAMVMLATAVSIVSLALL
ncbi:hypothetical protein P152DRAFT_467719 [Eremomyces bilateralis CBS 781.70]|uniref:Lysophospholipase n=1 Tax=Eremomyces bilateralis CBS 781.70 TaxID=1392243 RepID=A0A6G1FYA0_9PEZI|nr:uncharacterized protein P152DRAFT_467719 [Eremomyces bilateralis CBS 781.70]KAF1810692.1 hypothetical protein P152DRAFT_467719 [Eremomyces bilateralis CBS 781.70]